MKSKNRILFILQLPPPIHGASIMNSSVVNSKLIKQNFETQVIDLQFTKTLKDITRFSFRKVFKAFYYAFKIIEKILIYKPDLIYFTLSPTGFAFYRDVIYVFIFKIFRKGIVFHLHGKGFDRNANRNQILKKIITWVFDKTYVICVGRRLITDIDKFYKLNPFVVPCGIEERPKYDRVANRMDVTTPKIIFLSNYMREKGILILIEALNILKERGYKFEARLVGAPTDLSVQFLQNFINEKELSESIKVIGPVYGENKYKEYENADIFVLPTFNETFGLVLLEASQCGLPVISTNEGGIPDIIVDGETGFLVPVKDSEMLADKIAILLNNKRLRIEMGEKGYDRFINNFTLNHFERNLFKTFQQILNEAAR